MFVIIEPRERRLKSQCIEWPGPFHRGGYGYFYIRGHKELSAHRWAWILACGAIPAGLNVCHMCDNPRCVNVDHLFLGTDEMNSKDASRKGRLPGSGRKLNSSYR